VSSPRLGVGMRAVPRLCIELCPGIYLTTEENHGKTSVRAADAGPGRRPLFIPNSAGRLALPLDSLRCLLNEQAWLA